MTSLEAALRRIHTDLTEAHVSFALIGGLAVSARTEPRFTRDADLAVAVASDAEAEALIRRLRTRDYGIEAIVEQDAVGRLATVRLTRSSQPQAPVVDLLFASSGIEREVVTEADLIELLPNLTIGVARTGHLIALKVLSRDDVRRPQDLIDLRALLRVSHHPRSWRARESRSRSWRFADITGDATFCANYSSCSTPRSDSGRHARSMALYAIGRTHVVHAWALLHLAGRHASSGLGREWL